MAKKGRNFHYGRFIIAIIVIWIFGNAVFNIFDALSYSHQLDEEIKQTQEEIEYYQTQNELLEDPVYAQEYLRTKYFSEEGEIIYIFPQEETQPTQGE